MATIQSFLFTRGVQHISLALKLYSGKTQAKYFYLPKYTGVKLDCVTTYCDLPLQSHGERGLCMTHPAHGHQFDTTGLVGSYTSFNLL